MKLTGKNFIGSERSGSGKTFQAENPATCAVLSPEFFEATPAEINAAVEKASVAFQEYRDKTGIQKADFLEAIGEQIVALGAELIQRCTEETGLPEARIIGERGRTVGQLKLFAQLLREGSWVDARIDTADPARLPLPKPDVRSMLRPLGPVGIFGASNFPLAFSVAGGDTVSALAAGCTVVFKAHPAHPGTCELVANAIVEAVKISGMPDGTFSMVYGKSIEAGQFLVRHPLIKAIGFTGSYVGGKSIFDEANKRAEPIPVFAEMGSTNPVFILPEALSQRGEQISSELAASITQGVGQFCTNPGLVLVEESEGSTAFKKRIKNVFGDITSGVMLTHGMQENFSRGVERLQKVEGVRVLATGKNAGDGYQGIPSLLETTANTFLNEHTLEEEVFGPSSLIITAAKREDLMAVANKLSGHLTVTLHATENDLKEFSSLVSVLEQKAGRLIINGYPTGVEVCHSMVHGGPFPATSDSRSTSVGTRAITRFARPVCYQGFPQWLLPAELQDSNPNKISRLVNGNLQRD
ncbi:aldehyde dehydrogenase (NADP(+)) [Chryseosolibacter indicus]|uniref:Aldehyde dehydrogenase (NADP(+)) n=1 Tax=Chryseosolibacter indicus TaxID=2782351 RepID=A0ABS5VW43_9BACT|nr:aldehyde dehydrogenase (NADP(+)) [Chryseosolibacter indicus]MBT1705648.1 aldehyde dehydrogenase (NADP(+)) [Chryseosolibacter indicus]